MLILTDHIIDIIQKTIEMRYEEVLNNSDKILKKKIDKGIYDNLVCRYTYYINKQLSLYISIYPVEHTKYCETYNEGSIENIINHDKYCTECNRVYGYKLFFALQYYNGVSNILIKSFGIRTAHKDGEKIINNTWKECVDKMNSVIFKDTMYSFCKCGELCVFINGNRYDTCANCHINSYVRKEDCCVCLEDGYCWVQLKCNHIIHNYCWNTILKTNNQCPLCRAITSVEIINPYN